MLVTGHTGFTGGWLSEWLLGISADVFAVSLPPETDPNLYSLLKLGRRLKERFGDIVDYDLIVSLFEEIQPEIVLHLAAQSLVRRSYAEPLRTYRTNVMGTVNVLEAARLCPSTRVVVCVTTDKVYANQEWLWPYRENDPLGGSDPYSASKACAELVASSYQRTMALRGNDLAIATARGGNIIGGGDWAQERLVPDVVRAIVNETPLQVRNPSATRPWQHALALVHGYLVLADRLWREPETAIGAWNFAPSSQDAIPVHELIAKFAGNWRAPHVENEPTKLPEQQLLSVDATKARTKLSWCPPWDIDEACRYTVDWYRGFYDGTDAIELCQSQIRDYCSAASSRDL